MNVSEAENLGTVGPDGGDYVTNITDRVNEGAGPGVGREEAVDGSNPGFPASTSAISVQTPGHVGSIPAERVNRDARLILTGERHASQLAIFVRILQSGSVKRWTMKLRVWRVL